MGAAYAALSIIGIVGTVMASMNMMGWELGVLETIAVVIMIGFSVDYVVHLANSYVESHSQTRKQKTQDALYDMGISVIAGGITTAGAGCFLYFTVLLFFYKFALLMVFTILASWIWSLGFFISLVNCFGPEGTTGSLDPCLRAIYTRLRKDPSSETTSKGSSAKADS